MSKSPAPSDASHDSGSQDETQDDRSSKLASTKDKECQYCHQKFTSSSLGRHLDQFIHKKKPDGIHNVDEIRKLRAGITRRTARGNKKSGALGEHDEAPSPSANASPAPPHLVTPTTYLDNLNKGPPGTNDLRFNRMNWQATGVITDANTLSALQSSNTALASPAVQSSTSVSNVNAGTKRSFSTYAADLTPSTANETTRALELSLREVLDAVRAATKRAAPSLKPFSFDLLAQTFPSLCLALLPAPATLFKPSPFATPNTIPLVAPGPEQYSAIQQRIPIVVENWKWDALSHAQRNPIPGGASIADEVDYLSRSAQNWIKDANVHLDNAYSSFMNNSPEHRQHLWTVELIRAYKMEQDKVKETNDRIERITQETNQLQQQIDYLSRCQWPREMALWPPDHSVFNSRVQSELRALNLTALSEASGSITEDVASGGTNDPIRGDRWDFDKLLNKWKRHVREDRARRTGVQPQVSIPSGSGSNTISSILADQRDNFDGNGNNSATRTATPPSFVRKDGPESAGGGASQYSPATNGYNSTYRPSEGSGNNAMSGGSNSKPIAGTPTYYLPPPSRYGESPYATSSSAISKPSTPQVNVQIISDVHDHMARFAPWYKQQREQELRDKAAAEAEDASGSDVANGKDT